MELNARKNEFLQRRTLCDTVSEIGVESDIVLPDYCADIERILKCTLKARLSSKRLESTRLTLAGTAFMRLVYLTSDGNIGSFETQIPFSKNCEISCDGEDCSVRVKLRCEYVNCRAISARRFEVRGALSAHIDVKCRQSTEILSDIERENVELKKECKTAIVPVNTVCENFTVMEEYEISGAPISSVVRMTATPTLLDSKIVSGKLILKGEIALCIVYMPQESDEIKSVNFKVPVNHIMSAPNAEEDDIATLRLDIVRMSAEPVDRGEISEVAVEIFLEACADISRKKEVEFVTDAYCIGFESEGEFAQLEVVSLEDNVQKRQTVSATPDVEFAEILDVFAEILSCSVSANSQGEIMANADMNIAFLLRNAEGMPFVSEKNVKAEFSVGADNAFKNADCECEAEIVEANISSNKNGADIEIAVSCRVAKSEKITCLKDFEINEERPRERNRKTALTLYFAEEGEDVFDIAKRYNTSAKAVMQENCLTDSFINMQRAILIPMV